MDLLKAFSALAKLAPTTDAKKKAIAAIPGIQLPDDFDSLPEAEKQRRLDLAISVGLDESKPIPGKPKEVYNSLDEIFVDAGSHQVTAQELLNGHTKLFGSWCEIRIDHDLKINICTHLAESYGGRMRTQNIVFRKLQQTNPVPQHYSLSRFYLEKYKDKPAKLRYCAGQDQSWENKDARKFFTK